MNLELKGKKAVILAASSGLGQGIATVLAQEGCDIAICARNIEKLNKVAAEIREGSKANVLAISADVANSQSLNSFFDAVYGKFGSVDILINNAGGPVPGKTLDLSDEQYYSAFELTLMSVVRSCKRVVPGMIEKKWGRIINIESTSMKCALGNMVLSNVFRSGVGAFSKTLSMEYAKEGIRVHTVMPGPFLTNRVKELGAIASQQQGITFDKWKDNSESGTPLGRFGDPIELGNFVAFLVSEKSSYMNGTCIPVDGGILTTII